MWHSGPMQQDSDVALLTVTATARTLDTNLRAAEKAVRTRLLGPVYANERALMVGADAVETLGERRLTRLEDMPPALIVKVDQRRSIDDDPSDWTRRTGQRRRAWFGFDAAALTGDATERAELVAAWTRWWQVAEPESVVGKHVVALIAQWPADVRRIVGIVPRSDTTQVALVTEDAEADVRSQWLSARLAGLPGASTTRHRV